MRGGYTMGDGVADARAKVVSAHEESTPTGVLLRIVTQRRELVINLSRGDLWHRWCCMGRVGSRRR